MADDQDWRLKAALDSNVDRSALDDLVGRARGPDVVAEVGAAVPHDVVITHDGKLIRAEIEQTMRDAPDKLGLELEIHEHPHPLTTQVAFTVTGPRRKLDEFAEDLRAVELATLRAEREVMLSPL